jgi:hypothetical protein
MTTYISMAASAGILLAWAGCAIGDEPERLSETSSKVTRYHLTSAGGDELLTRRGRHVVLDVGPPPGGFVPGIGDGGDPAYAPPENYGICGFVHIAGYFDADAIAEIVVDRATGYYAVDVYEGTGDRMPDASPTVDVECVRLSDFTNLPNTEPVTSHTNGNSPSFRPTKWATVCPWAGFRGFLSAPNQDVTSSATLYDSSPATFVWASGVSSSAWCTNYGNSPITWITAPVDVDDRRVWGAGWIGSRYDARYPYSDDEWWCYMEGLRRYSNNGNVSFDIYREEYWVDPYTARFGYRYDVQDGVMSWNCIHRDQTWQ